MTDLKAKYADKIAKLLAKAESTTPEEAELLTAKAQELMAQYAIDEMMVEAARGFSKESGAIVQEEFVMIGIYRFPFADLCHRVLLLNECKVVQIGGKPSRMIDGKLYKETIVYHAVGYKGDLERARLLFTSLMVQAITAEGAWWRENRQFHEHEKKGGHYSRRQFLFSFSSTADQRLKAAKERGKKTAAKEHSSNSMALAVRDKSTAVLAVFEELHPDTRQGRSSYRTGSADAHYAGQEAGRRADIGQSRVSGGNKQLGG